MKLQYILASDGVFRILSAELTRDLSPDVCVGA
jgi:hypothetical protein